MDPIQLKIEGKQATADPRGVLTGPIEDLPEELARWRMLAATARREAARVDAEYRQWRALAQTAILADEPKIPEWKLKGRIEADSEFAMWKQGASKATWQAEVCAAMAEGIQATITLLGGGEAET
jgi:hypothetical protein